MQKECIGLIILRTFSRGASTPSLIEEGFGAEGALDVNGIARRDFARLALAYLSAELFQAAAIFFGLSNGDLCQQRFVRAV
jgi:hypothetical protein